MKSLAKIMMITSLISAPLISQADSGKHQMQGNSVYMGGMDHKNMKNESQKLIEGKGVINSVSVDKRVVNITHEPIPAINWPEMTMDLPVTKHVDLDSVKSGETVDFMLKLGRDKQYRITKISN